MASVPGIHVIPTNSWRFETGIEVTGLASAIVNAGDVVVSTDGINWAQAGVDEAGYVGVVMEDPTLGAAFASGDMITVRISGGAVVNSTAAVIDEGDALATGAAGTVVTKAIGAIGDVTLVMAKAVTAVDSSGGKLLVLLGGV